ncbi:unnamed protein product [Bursaphelenchus xylophilus]|uniref:(pine wood nematode) hypothetical protein n=1 Tax=Bursaphelenchus xylophilus TaxID=6326 RepID=A0A1I7RUZ0_BURXY|nr:unnamed protein product [Bursaphelenchus xylophilus]CAG9105289.1 unnamed protein product [Bursaphelenchus xylophilus]
MSTADQAEICLRGKATSVLYRFRAHWTWHGRRPADSGARFRGLSDARLLQRKITTLDVKSLQAEIQSDSVIFRQARLFFVSPSDLADVRELGMAGMIPVIAWTLEQTCGFLRRLNDYTKRYVLFERTYMSSVI